MADNLVDPEIKADVSGPDHESFPYKHGSKDGEKNGRALEIRRALDDAECLLHYASQAGIDILPDIMVAILAARQAFQRGVLDTPVIVAFLGANAKLSAKLMPVTAETVRASNEQIVTVVKWHGRLAVIITALAVVLSVFMFVTTSIGNDITDGITKTNTMAANARLHVGAPAISAITADEKCGEPVGESNPPFVPSATLTELDMISELQSFAASIRDLETSTIKLNGFVKNWETDPIHGIINSPGSNVPWADAQEALQLPPSLANFRAAALCKIAVYQQVRNFAQNVNADSMLFYGSLGKYVLPVMLALLGSLAYSLRDYTNRVRTRTYHPSYVDSARMIVAVIAGAIFGYFSSFTQGLNLLAAAFLVGYGVEIFFAFLDALLASFGAKKPAAAATPPA